MRNRMKTTGTSKCAKTDTPKRVRATVGAKARMIAALEKSLGVVTPAAKDAQIGRQTHYEWCKSDPDYARKVDETKNISLDFAETALMKTIRDGNTQAIIFYLECHGRGRGYIRKTDTTAEIKITNELERYSDAELASIMNGKQG
jgi:hypothetical protein